MTKSVFTDAYKLFLETLVAARKEARVDQTELADRIGWDQPKVSNAETGVRRIDVVEFITIAKALQIDPAAFIASLETRLPDRIDI